METLWSGVIILYLQFFADIEVIVKAVIILIDTCHPASTGVCAG